MQLTVIWDVSPVLTEIGPLTLRWYGLCFAVSFVLGLWMVGRMFRADGAPDSWLDKAFLAIVAGTVLGARLGHVFFYEWDYYSAHPGDIVRVWEGGLASHGGAMGILLALWIYSRLVTRRSVLWILDKIAVPTALAGAFIRFGNLMNSEIVGIPTDAPWGFLFVNARAPFNDVARHPVQLYESLGYALSFALLIYVYWYTDKRQRPGYIFGLFLLLIFGSRLLWEYFKTDQGGIQQAFGGFFSTGQLLSLPFVAAGLWLVLRPVEKRPTAVRAGARS